MRRFDPDRLKAKRAAAGMTLDDLAAKSGYDRASLWRMEAGEMTPRAGTLAAIAKALSVTVDDLCVAASTPRDDSRTAERLSALVDAESEIGPPSSHHEPAPRLTACALESIYAVWARHAAKQFCETFTVRRQGALTPEESSALAVAEGSAARFGLHLELRSGDVLDITGHATSAEVIGVLQDARANGRVKALLTVVTAEGEVFAFFGSDGLHRWTFLIEAAELAYDRKPAKRSVRRARRR